MKIQKVHIILVIAIMSLSCHRNGKTDPSQIRQEEYEVYNTILQEFVPSDEDSTWIKQFIQAETNHISLQKFKLYILPIYNTTVSPPSEAAGWDTTEMIFQRPPIEIAIPQPDIEGLDTKGSLHKRPLVKNNNQIGKNDILNSYTHNIFSYFAKALPPFIASSLFANFKDLDSMNQKLDSVRLKARLPFYLLSKSDYHNVLAMDSTSPNYKTSIAQYMQWHRWLIEFSRVGLDSTKRFAIVYFMVGQSGGGTMEIRLLERQGAKWVTIRKGHEMFI
jgi:hypothetical protein